MKYSRLVLAALLLPCSAYAEAEKFDVSGSDGSNGSSGRYGQSGSSPFWGGSNGQQGSDGDDGENGGTGRPGGSLDLEIGFVPGSDGGQIYVKGTEQRPEGGEDHVDRTFATDSLSSLDFIANGGTGGGGGTGGQGGSGGSGAHGSSGSSFGFNKDGGSGGNGGDGGRGGRGGSGGDGGSAGRVRVRLAAGSELLEPLVHITAHPGQGGRSGSGGGGGTSGSGGWGGSGTCETVNGKENCGSSGWSGHSGNNGTSGSDGSQGRMGASNLSQFLAANGNPIEGVYGIETERFNYDESIPDGVVEQGETLTVKSVVIHNTGKGAAPGAKYTLNLPNGETRKVSLSALAPDAEATIKIDPPIRVAARDDMSGFPYSLHMDHVNVDTQAPRQFDVQQPVQLVSATLDPLTTLEPQKDLVVEISNVSKRDYGAKGDVKRSITVHLDAVGGKNPPLVKIGDSFVRLDHPQDIQVPVVEAGEHVTVKVPVKVPDGWKPGSAARISTSLVVDQSKVRQAAQAKADYILDPHGAIKSSFDLGGSGVFCRFAWQVMKSGVLGMNIDKAANSDSVTVNLKLKGDRLSPAYTISMDALPAEFRDRLLHQNEISGDVWIELLKALTPPSSSMWSGWKVKTCEVNAGKVKAAPLTSPRDADEDAQEGNSDEPANPSAKDAR